MRVGFFLFLMFSITSCSNLSDSRSQFKRYVKRFSYQDVSGNFILLKELKFKKNKMVSRQRLYPLQGKGKEIESYVSISKLGVINKKRAILPLISQYKVWLGKKEYFSQMEVNKKSKTIKITKRSPESKWNGVEKISLPKGRFFCFFSQLTDCISGQNLFLLAQDKKVPIIILWDNYPYHEEFYEGMKSTAYSKAYFYMVEKNSKMAKFAIDIAGQVIFYHFNNALEFKKMFWITQGVSLTSFKE